MRGVVPAGILVALLVASPEAGADEVASAPPRPTLGLDLRVSLQATWVSALPGAPLQSHYPFRAPTPWAPKSDSAFGFGGGVDFLETWGHLLVPVGGVEMLFLYPPTVDLGGGAALHATSFTMVALLPGLGIRSTPGAWGVDATIQPALWIIGERGTVEGDGKSADASDAPALRLMARAHVEVCHWFGGQAGSMLKPHVCAFVAPSVSAVDPVVAVSVGITGGMF